MSESILNRCRSGARCPARRWRRLLALGSLFGALAAATPGGAVAQSLEPSQFGVKALCGEPAPGHSGCLGLELAPHAPLSRPDTRAVPASAAPPIEGEAPAVEGLPPDQAAEHKAPEVGSLSPANLLSAYGLSEATPPSQQTIALVDAYNDPGAEADLRVFDEQFALPECTAANGCFRQVNQHGESTNLPFPTTPRQLKLAREGSTAEREEAELAAGWSVEIATDVEVAHGICPGCEIVLVEASSNGNEDLYAAEDTAAALDATEISNSWGGEETSLDYAQFNHPGVVITASAGDNGYLDWLKGKLAKAPEYPASSPHVVAVGGTRLKLSPVTGAWLSETVWNDGGKKNTHPVEQHGVGGGGCSVEFTAPAWQQSVADWSSVGCGGKRAVADVSADADPYTGVAVYDSTEYEQSKGWATIGGTSVASPIVAAAFALAGGAHGVAYPAQTLYENELFDPASLHDVTVGSNGECHARVNETSGEAYGTASCSLTEQATVCSQHAICLAGAGYDGPTGVGTPNGLAAFRPLSEHANEGGVTPIEGSSSSQHVPGSSQPGTNTSAATTPNAGSKPAASAAPVLSALKLTRSAIAAIAAVAHRRAKLSQLGFSFKLSATARLRATLAVRVRVKGRLRWRTVSLQSFLARGGVQTHKLGSRAALAPGRYLLTLTPAGGATRSLAFRVA